MRDFIKKNRRLVLLLVTASLAIRLYFVFFFPHVGGDSIIYSAIARNLVQAHTYSASEQSPLTPTLIRTPGYPLFIAAVYKVFGVGNDSAVRACQVVLDCFTCLLAAGIALSFCPTDRGNTAACWTLAIACLCPFTANYTATILSETLAIFFSAASAFAFLRAVTGKRVRWWIITGTSCGLGVMVRPDSGLIVIALALTMLIVRLSRKELKTVLLEGCVFGLTFAAVLSPWTIRNAIVFHTFQPVNPFYAQAADEFTPTGYYEWIRTWLTDSKYIDPAIWQMGDQEADIDNYPPSAFDTPEERDRVGELIDQYNDELELTPGIDAQFRAIAQERISRRPLRFYLAIPLARAANLWFKPRTEILPFETEIFPIKQRVEDAPADYTVALLFEIVQWVLVLLAAGGLIVARANRDFLILFIASVVIRTGFLSTLYAPEPRYVLELFPLLFAAAGIGMSWLSPRVKHFFRADSHVPV